MPGITGVEVLSRIKSLSPDTEVIMITGHGDMYMAWNASETGFQLSDQTDR